GDSQTRPRVYPGRNAQLNRPFSLDAALPATFRATLADNLPRPLASRARPCNCEKSLLICELPPPPAGLTGSRPRAGFRPGSLARAAEFLTRHFDLGRDARRALFKRQRHVIPQIRSALAARPSPPPS